MNYRTPLPNVCTYWPATFYGPEGQSAAFNGPLKVPDGWHDDPNKVGDPDAVTELPGYDEAVAAAEATPAPVAEIGDDDDNDDADGELTKADIVARLTAKEATFNANWNKARLAALLEDLSKDD